MSQVQAAPATTAGVLAAWTSEQARIDRLPSHGAWQEREARAAKAFSYLPVAFKAAREEDDCHLLRTCEVALRSPYRRAYLWPMMRSLSPVQVVPAPRVASCQTGG